MTTIAHSNRRFNQSRFAGLALAAALVAALAGGAVGAFIASALDVQPASAPIVRVLDPKWVEYGNSWEARYRQMYPITLDPKWVEYGEKWLWQYRAQHPEL